MKQPCHNEEVLVDYLEGRLPETKRAALEAHLADCRECREMATVFGALSAEDPLLEGEHAPPAVVNRAINSVTELETDSIRTKLERSVEKFRSNWRNVWGRMELMLAGEPVLVRSSRSAGGNDMVRITKSLPGMEAAIDIEKSGEEEASIRIDLTGAEKEVPPVRVTLFQNDRETASFLSTGSPTMFEDVPYGSYVLAFFRQGDKIGEYPFEIRESKNTR